MFSSNLSNTVQRTVQHFITQKLQMITIFNPCTAEIEMRRDEKAKHMRTEVDNKYNSGCWNSL